MSLEALSFYLDHSELKGNEKLCMIALADYADEDGQCFPGHKRIAKRLSMAESGARKVLYRLRDKGELRIDERSGIVTKNGPTNRYTLTKFAERKGVPARTGCPSQDRVGCPTQDRVGCPTQDTDPSVVTTSSNLSNNIGQASLGITPEVKATIKPKSETPPAALVFREVHHRSMKKNTYDLVAGIDDMDKWKDICTQWKARGYNLYNLAGQIDWYHNGVRTANNKRNQPIAPGVASWDTSAPEHPANKNRKTVVVEDIYADIGELDF